ncbi:MAG: HAMP domain-containing histidine kinase [Rhodocyclaceae bacterium]|nr:HAMP domain-containing histidine kinase [Rhodocyclaceae bacterium]
MSVEPTAPTTRHLGHIARLVSLRWLSIGVMLAIALGAEPLFGIRVPLVPVLIVSAALGAWNLLARRATLENGRWHVLLELLIDLAAWTSFLYLTGGATNPLISLLLPLIAVGAAVLPAAQTWLLSLLAVGAYTWLWNHHLPLGLQDPAQAVHWHLAGMWVTFALSAAVVTWYVSRMTQAMRLRDQALAEAREKRLRSERILAMANLAAGAAHEMGTPLATMKLLVDGLRSGDNPAQADEDLALMSQQIGHCREILTRLAEAGGRPRPESARRTALGPWLDALINTLRTQRPDLRVSRTQADATADLIADTALDQAMRNLINNAASAAPDTPVDISTTCHGELLQVRIADRGAGMPAAVLATLNAPESRRHLPSEGLGIGLMLSISAIEQLGGSLEYTPRHGGGTIATVTLPTASP